MMTSVDRLLAESRVGLSRIAPADFDGAVEAGALVVDVRPVEVRRKFGELDRALVIGLNVLEWRLAPDSPDRILDVDLDRVMLLVCHQGYSSSLAAYRCQQLGFSRATDLIGGHAALLSFRSDSSAPAPVDAPASP